MNKVMKRTVNYMAWGLVLYSILCFVVNILCLVGYLILSWLKMQTGNQMSEVQVDFVFEAVKNENLLGGISCISVIVGTLFLFCYFRNRVDRKQMFASHKKMSPKSFGMILCVLMGVQLVAEFLYWMIEKSFNVFGYSVMVSIEESYAQETAILLILYAAIIGPVAEEVIYRGFVLSTVQKCGKLFGIMVSAVLFGIMHANIPQAALAFLIGLILGYVAVEYSIGWAILLHVINNGVFGELLYALTLGLGEQQQNTVIDGLMVIFFLLAVYFLWIKRNDIRQYLMVNKVGSKEILYAFTAIGMIVFVAMEMLSAFSDIKKISM